MTTTPAQPAARDFDAHVMERSVHLGCVRPGHLMVVEYRGRIASYWTRSHFMGDHSAHVVMFYEHAKVRQLSDSSSSPDPDPDFSDIPLLQVEHLCYQCMQPAAYLFDDGRCCHCTRLLPEEIVGSVYEHSPPLDDEITVLLDAAFGSSGLSACSISLSPQEWRGAPPQVGFRPVGRP